MSPGEKLGMKMLAWATGIFLVVWACERIGVSGK